MESINWLNYLNQCINIKNDDRTWMADNGQHYKSDMHILKIY